MNLASRLEELRGLQVFTAEGAVDSTRSNVGEPPTVILEFECPEGHMAVAESIVIQASHPQAFYQCLFDIAVNDERIESIAFNVYPSPADSPFNYGYWFAEGQRIQLRFTRTLLVTELCFNLQLYAKIKGHYMEKE